MVKQVLGDDPYMGSRHFWRDNSLDDTAPATSLGDYRDRVNRY